MALGGSAGPVVSLPRSPSRSPAFQRQVECPHDRKHPRPTIGLLLSGGLDSSILLGRLLEQRERVQPFYVRSGLVWQEAELRSGARIRGGLARPALWPLITIDLPLADVYGEHWCVTGRQVPDANSPDEAVYLPGRNALLVIKAALWCQLQQRAGLGAGHAGVESVCRCHAGAFFMMWKWRSIAASARG